MSGIERRITIEHPTRYEAFANPRILFEQKNTALTGNYAGREFAVYHEPIQNRDYPELQDGLYAEVCSFQRRYYLATVQATQPWKGRKQSSAHKNFAKYVDAVNWLLEQIPKFQEFLQEEKEI